MELTKEITVTPKYPLFWQALYPSHVQELKIPVCKRCGHLIKVSSYDDIRCPNMVEEGVSDEVLDEGVERIHEQFEGSKDELPSDEDLRNALREKLGNVAPCGSTEYSFNPDDGALVIPIQDGVLSEFDAEGNEPINFKYIPTDGLHAFGLIDPLLRPPTFYMINLRTGNIEVGCVNANNGIPLGVGIDFPTKDGSNLIPISNVLQRYGQGGDLIHYKRGSQSFNMHLRQKGKRVAQMMEMDPNSFSINHIVVGYKCKIPGWHCQVKIMVNCKTHLPHITTKATPVEEDDDA